MSNKNNSPIEKAEWLANRSLHSKFVVAIPPSLYHPEPKPPSKRDLHREIAANRRSHEQWITQRPMRHMLAAYLGPVERFQFCVFKQTIYQLAKLARCLPRLRRRCLQALTKKRLPADALTDLQVTSLRARLGGCSVAAGMLKEDFRERHIEEKPFRDATPHLLRSRVVSGMDLPLPPTFETIQTPS